MSIALHIYYTGENGAAKAFAREMTESGLVEKIRNENGNRQYEYFFSEERPETVLLLDKWKNQEALDMHHNSEIMEKIFDLREKYGLKMIAERFESDSISEEDKKYIKE